MTDDESQTTPINRPDPAFKLLTRQVAIELGLQPVETEFPQTLRADLILKVPEGLDLSETMFSFFRSFNVLEFKSQGDFFDEKSYVINEVRTALFYLQNDEATYENLLNIIVTSRYPSKFFAFMRKRGCRFRSNKATPWLKYCRVGLQDVVIVSCRDLPIEQRYYQWLIFAPADSQK